MLQLSSCLTGGREWTSFSRVARARARQLNRRSEKSSGCFFAFNASPLPNTNTPSSGAIMSCSRVALSSFLALGVVGIAKQ
ncbi:hypothetical protein BDW68DRAFT_100166 [Aspergillus falconensis]